MIGNLCERWSHMEVLDCSIFSTVVFFFSVIWQFRILCIGPLWGKKSISVLCVIINRFSLVGIVRNIDPVEKLLFVLTPLGLDDLKQVNTLLKGNLEIPAALLLSVSRRE